jgi:cyclomaltodextrinase / maltogenic alpha-amylase / neopullulanase
MLMKFLKIKLRDCEMKLKIGITVLLVIVIVSGGFAMHKRQLALDGKLIFKVDSLNEGVTEKWFAKNYDRSAWSEVEIPSYWDRYHNMEKYDGAGWFARAIEIKNAAQPLSIFFSGVDDDADVWVNGEKVGAHTGYSESFSIQIDKAVKVGINEIVVRVNDNSGPGGIYKPVKIIATDEVDDQLKTKYAQIEAKKSAEWVKNAVIYEVYLRSFSKEGTFKALETRISELKELGVTVVWLMPIHPTGKEQRKGTLGSPYSVQDYYAVNPEFGTLEDFKSLVNAVHKQGLKIIIDLVANHTAWDNPMLIEHPEWYTHSTTGKIIPPNPDWSDVADLNYENQGLRKYMTEMMKYWVRDIGIDGYRCDVAELVPTDFWENAVAELEAIKPVMMLSEGTLPEHHVKAFDLTYSWNVYDVLGKVMSGSTPATIFHNILKTESYQFPKGSLRMRFNTNHDKNAYDGPAFEMFTPQGAKATAVLAFTFPGIPLIYNGEEVGNDKRLDLFEKVDIDWTKNAEFRELYRKLSELRKLHPALVGGSYAALENSDSKSVLSFIRSNGKDSIAVVINFQVDLQKLKMSLPSSRIKAWRDVINEVTYQVQSDEINISIPRFGFFVLVPIE